MNITTSQTAITIPFDTAIALYRSGYMDPAFLGYFLPIAIAAEHCPEIYRDGFELDKLALVLGENDIKGELK